jgi:hypothetical protein
MEDDRDPDLRARRGEIGRIGGGVPVGEEREGQDGP